MKVQTISIALALSFIQLLSPALAEDLSSCTLKKTPDEVNYCKASFAGSGTFCDLIKNGEKKRECIFMVVKVQRKNTYRVPNPNDPKPESNQ